MSTPAPSQKPTQSYRPSQTPTQSYRPTLSFKPTFSKSPTFEPTVVVKQKPYGQSSFGAGKESQLIQAGQHEIRRSGWSWTPEQLGTPPFCWGNECFNVTEVCEDYNGIRIGDSICAFPNEVNVAGVSCWHDQCYGENSTGPAVCDSVGGTTVYGGDGVQWCVYNGDYTLLGPACYRTTCWTDQLKQDCDSKGGVIWNDIFCLIPGDYTVVGPACWEGACLSITQSCEKLEGTIMAYSFCLLDGCDYSVLGPFCYSDPGETIGECYDDRLMDVCEFLDGQEFARRFCVLDGKNSHSIVGPACYSEACAIGNMNEFCRDLGGQNVDGVLCILPGEFVTFGPYCFDGVCYTENMTEVCDEWRGEIVGDYCTVAGSDFGQVIGPNLWNSNFTDGPTDYCRGPYCAIPRYLDSTSRCPASSSNGSPSGDPGNGPSDDPSTKPSAAFAPSYAAGNTALVLGVTCLVVFRLVWR